MDVNNKMVLNPVTGENVSVPDETEHRIDTMMSELTDVEKGIIALLNVAAKLAMTGDLPGGKSVHTAMHVLADDDALVERCQRMYFKILDVLNEGMPDGNS